MRIAIITLFAVASSAFISAFAAPVSYNIRSFSVNEGLSQSMVYSIAQDNNGFMWFGTQDGLNRYDGHVFRIYKNIPGSPNSIGCDKHFCSWVNDDHKIWFGTANGVYIYDPSKENFKKLKVDGYGADQIDFCVRHISKDREENIWIAGDSASVFCLIKGKGLLRYDIAKWAKENGLDAKTLSVRSVLRDEDTLYAATTGAGLLRIDLISKEVTGFAQKELGGNEDVTCMIPYVQKRMLLGTSSHGVLCYDRSSGTVSHLIQPSQNPECCNLYVRALLLASDGKIWVGTESGVWIYIPVDGSVSHVNHRYNDQYSISDNAVHTIAEDRDGGIWVGTYFGGVNYFAKVNLFDRYYPVPGMNSISGRCISEICEDIHGKLWIATEDAGLSVLDKSHNDFSRVAIPATNVHALMSDGKKMWVGTFSDGLYIMDTKTQKIITHVTREGGLLSNDIYSVFKDSYGMIWVGTSSGLNCYDVVSHTFVTVNHEKIRQQVNDIMEDDHGKLWFSTIGDGVWTYDRHSERWEGYSTALDGSQISESLSITKDKNNQIWLGTNGLGVFLYNGEADAFSRKYDTEHGLRSDVIYRLLTDRSGAVWGSTNKGLFRIDPLSESISCYTKSNGLLCDQFNYKSGFMDSAGVLYFGGISGLVSFVPEKVAQSSARGKLLFSSLYVNNMEVMPEDANMPLLEKSMIESKSLVIPPSISTFSIGVTEINWADSEDMSFEYKLDGWDNLWIPIGLPDKVTYSNLPPGKYTLRIRCEDELVAPLELSIAIQPPFWRSKWACVLYALALLLFVRVSVYSYRKKKKIEEQRREEQIEQDREREVYEAKIGFFSSITHEIRTPLTLIKLPLNEIIDKTDKSASEYKNLLTIRSNADRLLNLVNQLLDFRKVTVGTNKPIFMNVDIHKLMLSVISRFAPTAKIRGIALTYNIPESIKADVDSEMLVKMVSNLMNNALKHAQTSIAVNLAVSDGYMAIDVSNDGDVIPIEVREKIFAPFFKVDNTSDGFGVGLSLVKSLAELHEGTIRCLDQEDGWTMFELKLPLAHPGSVRLSMEDTDNESEPEDVYVRRNEVGGSKKSILLVDDNMDFLNYMSSTLGAEYKVYKAANGLEAIDFILKQSVDLVISDILMPGLDGLELCQKVKSDIRLKHIPIVLLSSGVGSPNSKANAYQAGADLVVEKPFYYEYLIACIHNLLKLNCVTEVNEADARQTFEKEVVSKVDDGFLKVLVDLIEDHIEDVDLDINKLAAMMNMSRATLYRRTSEVLRVTPNDFIRTIRLKKAAELLRQKEYRVNEIAYIVGFRSSSYFSKCFYKHYGVLPKNF